HRRTHDGTREASFEANASEDYLTGIGGRWGLFGDGGRRICNYADSECTIVTRHLTAPCS
ncbi:MAG: hypothetical protein WA309_12405, partial [Pseudolabrys sp.]